MRHKVALRTCSENSIRDQESKSSCSAASKLPHLSLESRSRWCWAASALFTQLAQEFTWLGGNSTVGMHVLPNRQTSGRSKGRMESTHCTVHTAQTHQRALHASSLAFTQALTTLTETTPAFFTPRVDSQELRQCRCRTGPLLLPMRPCHWAFSSLSAQAAPKAPVAHTHTQREREAQSYERTEKGFLLSIRFCLHAPARFTL